MGVFTAENKSPLLSTWAITGSLLGCRSEYSIACFICCQEFCFFLPSYLNFFPVLYKYEEQRLSRQASDTFNCNLMKCTVGKWMICVSLPKGIIDVLCVEFIWTASFTNWILHETMMKGCLLKCYDTQISQIPERSLYGVDGNLICSCLLRNTSESIFVHERGHKAKMRAGLKMRI